MREEPLNYDLLRRIMKHWFADGRRRLRKKHIGLEKDYLRIKPYDVGLAYFPYCVWALTPGFESKISAHLQQLTALEKWDSFKVFRQLREYSPYPSKSLEPLAFQCHLIHAAPEIWSKRPNLVELKSDLQILSALARRTSPRLFLASQILTYKYDDLAKVSDEYEEWSRWWPSELRPWQCDLETESLLKPPSEIATDAEMLLSLVPDGSFQRRRYDAAGMALAKTACAYWISVGVPVLEKENFSWFNKYFHEVCKISNHKAKDDRHRLWNDLSMLLA